MTQTFVFCDVKQHIHLFESLATHFLQTQFLNKVLEAIVCLTFQTEIITATFVKNNW